LAVDGADHWINKVILDATKIFSEGVTYQSEAKGEGMRQEPHVFGSRLSVSGNRRRRLPKAR